MKKLGNMSQIVETQINDIGNEVNSLEEKMQTHSFEMMSIQPIFPSHGRIDCPLGNICYQKKPMWGKSYFKEEDWRIDYNPAAWGNQKPIVVILGMSKGFSQINGIIDLNHNEIPFRGRTLEKI